VVGDTTTSNNNINNFNILQLQKNIKKLTVRAGLLYLCFSSSFFGAIMGYIRGGLLYFRTLVNVLST